MNNRPPAQPPRRQHGTTSAHGIRRPPPVRDRQPVDRSATDDGRRTAGHSAAHGTLGRWMPVIAAAAVLTVVVFVGFSGDGSSGSVAPGENPGAVDVSLTVPSEVPPGVVIGSGGPTVKTNLSAPLSYGAKGPEVEALQTRLKELGFDPGPVDGEFGSGTRGAVWAFEGLVYDKPYDEQVGVVDNEMWQMMQEPLVFQPRRSELNDIHMEIYLPLQAAIVFNNDEPTLITHISSGSGEQWCEVVTVDSDDYGNPLEEPELQDICGESKTPGGIFIFYRRVEGKRNGPLGGMMNPVYFNYGIAVHGADVVPNYPASHGCIRIPQWIARYFPSLVGKNDRVYVWGLDGKEPEEYTKDEMLPVFNWKNPNSTLTLEPTTTTTKPTPTTSRPTPTTVRPTTTTTATTVATTTSVPASVP